ncbi:hypothetical protein NYR54_04145 [Chelativorans sp. SCAU2101]|uniref:Uncharacterized protein n=1 Tax=Chelativorans petroleitrophicus TaxID=2975484 RepID=A0A9X2X898_9HYPH|nr:hypothetical protein [Chelativorans petroleitrophicus]MCT8989490.1 hypothetical protein [Chelativorans petroleitrophicus]
MSGANTCRRVRGIRIHGIIVAVPGTAIVVLAAGSWLTADKLMATLAVGAPTAQGSGWPAQQ